MHKFFVVIIGLLMTTFLMGQDMITDRPDFTESAVVVPAKMVQIESGVGYSKFGDVKEFSFPNALARIGLGHNFEVRLGFPGWLNIDVNDKSEMYLNDLLFEAKYQLTKADAEIPMALMFVATLPTGDDEVSAESAEFGFKFAIARDLNDRLSLGVNVGAISVEVADERELLSLASVSLGIGINEKVGAFVETFAEMPKEATWQPSVDGGFTYLFTPEAQLDAYVGIGLNDYASDMFAGLGFTIRFGY